MAINIASNLVGALIPLGLTLFTVPVYLQHVGAGRYGVILIAWSLLGYFGFMDLGISRATTNALAQMTGENQQLAKERAFWSSCIVNGCLGLVGGLILYCVASYLFGHVMKVAPDIREEVNQSIIYLACMLPVALMMGVGVGAAEAHERFVVLNVIQTTGLILGQALPLLAVLYCGPSLTIIMPIMLVVRLFTFVCVMFFAIHVSGIAWRPTVDWRAVRALFSFGGWVTVSNIISPIMTNVDQFVIGSLRTVAQVPFYSVPMNIIQRTQILPTMLTRTLFPVFSRLGHIDGRDIVSTTLCYLATLVTVVYIGAVFLAAPFLHIWLGPVMEANAAPVFQILSLGAWWNSLAFILYSALQGQGRPRAVATIHSIEVLPYIAILYFSVRYFGLAGAAGAWSLRVAVDALMLARAYRLEGGVIRAILPGFATLVISFAFVWIVHPGIILSICVCAAACLFFLAMNAANNQPYRQLLAYCWNSIAARRIAKA